MMDVDPLEGSSYDVNNLLKIEIDVKVELEEICNNLSYSDLTFSDSEVAVDPITGLSVCLLCLESLEKEYVTEHMVKQHKYRKLLFKCWNCESTFLERTLLNEHKQSCHPKKYQKRTLQRLIREADRSDTNVCAVCLIEVVDGSLKEHLEEHRTKVVRPKKVPAACGLCGKSFSSKMTLGQHVKHVHKSKEGSAACAQCGKTFKSHVYLNNHTRNVHPTGNKVHFCELCKKSYKSHQSLYQHMKHVHLARAITNTVHTRLRDQWQQHHNLYKVE